MYVSIKSKYFVANKMVLSKYESIDWKTIEMWAWTVRNVNTHFKWGTQRTWWLFTSAQQLNSANNIDFGLLLEQTCVFDNEYFETVFLLIKSILERRLENELDDNTRTSKLERFNLIFNYVSSLTF